jgi:MFS transporter, ACS family, tartrate transporter
VAALDDLEERRLLDRLYWRLIPLFFLMMLCNYLFRVNVGFAALRMNQDLGFSASIYGFGASVFFAGYVVLQIPSNLMVYKLGARVWLCGMLVTWSMVSMATAFIANDWSFYSLRLLLGLAEGGFLPAAALYVTYWFPQAYRARAIAGYIIATSFSTIIGGPLSGAIMTFMDGILGLAGWQWMFIIEGVPALILAAVVFVSLNDQPHDALWLDAKSRDWLLSKLRAEHAAMDHKENESLFGIVKDPRVWSLGLLFGSGLIGLYGLLLWLPQIIKAMGNLTDFEANTLSALPPALGVVGAILVSRSSDKRGDRKGHMAVCYFVSGLGLLASALVSDPVLAYAFLCIGNGAVLSASPLFWTIAGTFFRGAAAAAAIAFVNIVAQVGGVGPYLIGAVRDATGSFTLALVTLAGFSFLAAIIALAMKAEPKRGAAPAVAE